MYVAPPIKHSPVHPPFMAQTISTFPTVFYTSLEEHMTTNGYCSGPLMDFFTLHGVDVSFNNHNDVNNGVDGSAGGSFGELRQKW